LWLEVDGKRYQNGSTSTMIFGVPYLVSYLSQFMSLQPGDIIATGTPPGVGMGQKPPTYLKPGSVVRLGVEGLVEQQQRTVAWSKQDAAGSSPHGRRLRPECCRGLQRNVPAVAHIGRTGRSDPDARRRPRPL